jgi:hypothetical protein
MLEDIIECLNYWLHGIIPPRHIGDRCAGVLCVIGFYNLGGGCLLLFNTLGL